MVPNIRAPLRKSARHFKELREAKANASDAVARLRHFFEEVLGYDGVKDISRRGEGDATRIDVASPLSPLC